MPLPVRWRYKFDRWRSQIAAMFHSEPKTMRPRLCPACGTLVGSTATKCHQCGASMTFSMAAASRSLGPVYAADFARDVHNAGNLLRDVCAGVRDHDESFGRRRAGAD